MATQPHTTVAIALLGALLALAASPALASYRMPPAKSYMHRPPPAKKMSESKVEHVVLLSIDGAHALTVHVSCLLRGPVERVCMHLWDAVVCNQYQPCLKLASHLLAGLHSGDLTWWLANRPMSALAKLAMSGVVYPQAFVKGASTRLYRPIH